MNSENKDNSFQGDNLKRLLELNLQKNEEILLISKKIKTHMKWQRIWSFARFLLIAIPIILGFIYLPPYVRDFFSNYKTFFK